MKQGMDNGARELMSFRGAELFRDVPRDFSWARAFKEYKMIFILVSNRDVLIHTKKCSVYHSASNLTTVGQFESKDDGSAEFCISKFQKAMPIHFLGQKGTERTMVAAIDASNADACSSPGMVLDRIQDELGATRQALRSLALVKEDAHQGDADISAAGIAVALCQWHRDHLFCCKCGSSTKPHRLGTDVFWFVFTSMRASVFLTYLIMIVLLQELEEFAFPILYISIIPASIQWSSCW
jgi:NADH pyrophosphatase NudC (nudix superfamily)